MWNLTCPKCGAPTDRAQLRIVSGTFECQGVFLAEDGFALCDARQLSTDNELVFCGACEKTFPLHECAKE